MKKAIKSKKLVCSIFFLSTFILSSIFILYLNIEIKNKKNYTKNNESLNSETNFDTPISASFVSWWDSSYKYRIPLTIINTNSREIPKGYSTKVSIDTFSLISQGKLLIDGKDLRIVWFNPLKSSYLELNRVNETNFNTKSTEILFKTQAIISAITNDTNYYIYYGNKNANNPPDNRKEIYDYFDDFSQPDGAANDWEITQGTAWSVLNKEYLNTDKEIDRRTILKNYLVQNASIEVKIKHANGDTFGGGVIFRYFNSSQYFTVGLGFYDYFIGLGSQDGDTYPEYIYGKVTESELVVNNWYNLKIDAIGSTFKFYINNKIQFEHYSLINKHFKAGQIGFMTWTTTSDVHFDDLKIKLLLEKEPLLKLNSEESFRNLNFNDFKYYKRIVIDRTIVSGTTTLLNFPVLISLDDSDLRTKCQPDGNDLAFSDGINWLNHEIEYFTQNYNNTHAKLIVWVKIPSLSPSIDTIIYMYYGNSTMYSRENPKDVWDKNFKGVWHLSEDPTKTIHDSTSNNNDAIANNMIPIDQVRGKIDGCLDFEAKASQQYINCGNDKSLDITKELTVEFWLNLDKIAPKNYWPNLIGKGNENSDGWRVYVDSGTKRIEFGYRENTNKNSYWILNSGNVIKVDKWHHIVLSFSLSNSLAQMYLDGNAISTNRTGIFQIISNTKNLYIADFSEGGQFDGLLDEVRISNLSRSSNWIITEYNNQQNPNNFAKISSEIDNNIIFIDDLEPYDSGSITWKEASTKWWCKGTGSYNNPFVIENIKIIGKGSEACIKIKDSRSLFFVVRNSVFYNASSGILLEDSSLGLIENNTCINNSQTYISFGIYLLNSFNNTVLKNNASSNNAAFGGIGITLHNSYNNSIIENLAYKNSHDGILALNSNYNYFEDNILQENKIAGISFHKSNYSKVLNNQVINNLKNGIEIIESKNNNLERNIISKNNVYGLFLDLQSENNNILQNEFYNNSDIGLAIGSIAQNNLIYNNKLIQNKINAQDNGTNNKWDNDIIGNYWNDYYGQDEDDNRIGDTPYVVSGLSKAKDNLPIVFVSIDNIPPRYSNLVESLDPLELGLTEIISLKVFDPAGVKNVIIEFEGKNNSMNYVGGNIWQYDSWTPKKVGFNNYSIYMQDNHDNWNLTKNSIKVIDTTPPKLSKLIESSNPLELGNYVTISIEIYDISGVNGAIIIIDGSSHYLTKLNDNKWQYKDWKPVKKGNFSYTIYARDNNNNPNIISGVIKVIDTTPCTILALSESADPLELGNNEKIKVKASDLSGIKQALIEFEGINHSMIQDNDQEFEFDLWIPNRVGIHYYTIYIEDNSNNWNFISSSIEVIDTTPPKLINLIEKSDPLELGNTLNIKVITSDYSGIKQVLIEYDELLHTFQHKEEDLWEYEMWTPLSIGVFSYIIYIEDYNNNWNLIRDSIIVIDTTPPKYSNLIENKDPSILGDSINISIIIEDPSGINQVLIEIGEYNYSMKYKGNNIWIYDSWTPNATGLYAYTIYMEDNNNNWNFVKGNISIVYETNSNAGSGVNQSGSGGSKADSNKMDQNSLQFILVISTIFIGSVGTISSIIVIKKLRSKKTEKAIPTKMVQSSGLIKKQLVNEKDLLISKREQLLKNAKIAVKNGYYTNASDLYRLCSNISKSLLKLGYLEETKNIDTFANLELKCYSIDQYLAITVSCINDLLTEFGNNYDIWYYVHPKVYSGIDKCADGLFLNNNKLLQSRLKLEEDGINLSEEIGINSEKLDGIRAFQFKYTNDLSEANLIEIAKNLQNSNIVLFIVCLKWPIYEYKRTKKLAQNIDIEYPENVFIIKYDLFTELIALENDYLEKFNQIVDLNNQEKIEDLTKIHNSNVAVTHDNDDLIDDLKEKGLIEKNLDEYFNDLEIK